MALVLGVNSYIDVATADLYFADRLNTAVWDTASPEDKEKSLVMSTSMIDCLFIFTGNKTDPEQPLEFPREPDTTIPHALEVATAEQAFYLLTVGDTTVYAPQLTPDIIKAKLDVMEVEYAELDHSHQMLLAPCLKYILDAYGKAKRGVYDNGPYISCGITKRN